MSWNVLGLEMRGPTHFGKGIDVISLGPRLFSRQEGARCPRTCKFQPVWRDSISWCCRNAAGMRFCRGKLRGRDGWGSQVPIQCRGKKKVPHPDCRE